MKQNYDDAKRDDLKPFFQDVFPFNSSQILNIFTIFKKQHYTVYFVGGIVRDALIKHKMKPENELDIDLCVNCEIENIEKILTQNNIKYIPTGIKFGTVTILLNDLKIEITATRKDIETFGRDATTVFTDSIKQDSMRRDFTINALYLDDEYNVYDFHDGIKHIKQKQICFIGNTKSRIIEDHLRIFRFIRFISILENFKYNDFDFEIIKDNIELVKKISTERKASELCKTFCGINFCNIIKFLSEIKILNYIIPFKISQNYETIKNIAPNSNIEFYIIELFKSKTVALSFATQFLLGKKTINKLKKYFEILSDIKTKKIEYVLYYHDKQHIFDCINHLHQIENISIDKINNIKTKIQNFTPPQFPLQSMHLVKIGIKPGPNFGILLKAVENWWIEHDFKPKLNDCIIYLKTIEK